MTVSLLQLHRMSLLYEFLKETSIYSAFEREEVTAVILRNLLNGLHSSPVSHQLFCNKQCFHDFSELTQCPVFFLLSTMYTHRLKFSPQKTCLTVQDRAITGFLCIIPFAHFFLALRHWAWKGTGSFHSPWGRCLSISVPLNVCGEAAQPWGQGLHRNAGSGIFILSLEPFRGLLRCTTLQTRLSAHFSMLDRCFIPSHCYSAIAAFQPTPIWTDWSTGCLWWAACFTSHMSELRGMWWVRAHSSHRGIWWLFMPHEG